MSENAKTIWRNAWLNGINELSSIELQRRTWLNPESDYYWSYSEFMDRYFDTIMMMEDPQHFISKKFMTGQEYQAIKDWYETLMNYEVDDDEGDEFDHMAILNDPKWQAIVKKGEQAKNALASLLSGNEKAILTMVISSDTIPDYIQKLAQEQLDWEEFMDEGDLEEQEILREALNDEAFGETPESRASSIKKTKILSWILNGISAVLSIWLIMKPDPDPYLLRSVLYSPLVLLVIFLISEGRFRLDVNKQMAYPSLVIGIFFSTTALYIKSDSLLLEAFDYDNAWLYSGIIFVIIEVLIFWDKDKRPSLDLTDFLAFLVPHAVIYAYVFFACLYINFMYAKADPVIYRVKIIQKHQAGKDSEYRTLDLEPWGNPAEAKPVEVSTEYHKMLEQGDSVIIFVTTGALDIPYYQVLEPIESKE